MNIKYILHFASSHNNSLLILYEYIIKHFFRIAIYIVSIRILNQLKHQLNTMKEILCQISIYNYSHIDVYNRKEI